MMKYDRVVNEDGELGVFVPDAIKAVIRTPEELEKARLRATLAPKKRFHHGRNYIVSYNDTLSAVIRDLSLTEAGAMVKIMLQLRIKSDGKLVKGAEGDPMNKSDIARLLDRSRSNANALVGRLAELGLIELKDDGIYVSSRFHTMGGRIKNEVFTKVYTVKARQTIANLRLNEIGMLYKIIPFFHYSEYYLCADPNAEKADIDYIGRETLAELIGHDASTVSKIMGRLQGVGAVLVTGARNEVRYLVHPDLLFRQPEGFKTEWTVAVRKLFDDHAKKAR